MNKIFVDPFLASNWLLIKSCCFLWKHAISDLIFIPYINKILIKSKHLSLSEIIGEIDHNTFQHMCFQLKLFCKLNLLNDSLPQSCSINMKINDEIYWFRCSFHPSLHGNSLSIRYIRSEFFTWKEKIEFTGLNIIFGKTGSGKSTILYGIMSNFDGHGVSLEEPIEYELPNVCQTDVTNLGYLAAVKSVLRQCPDRIYIGEIRDIESANAAITAALTGHTVITTMHAGNIQNIFNRMKQMNCINFSNVINTFIFVNDFKYQIIESYDIIDYEK